MQKGLIGVIVPVYKVEKYIAECIESILAQSYTNFRLILVDDGTPDDAGRICDEYAKKDSRITVIHQENSGVTRARARGVEEAEDCEFITFVDSDDTISTDYLGQLYNTANDEIDIVINENHTQKFISLEKYIQLLIQGDTSVNLGPVCKLFRKKLFNEETFNIPRSIVVGEDMLMNIRLAFSGDKESIAIINEPCAYNYRQCESSIMHSFKSTPEYEHLFQQHLKKSIPDDEKEKYFVFTIKNRLRNFKRFWGKKCCVKGMKETLFYQELKSDIEENKYALSPVEHTLFTNESPVVRFFAIIARGILKPFSKKQ